MKLLFIFFLIFSLSSALYFKSKFVEKLIPETYERVVMQSRVPWFLNFGGDSCHECRQIESAFEQSCKALDGIARCGYVNPKSGQGIIDRFGIGGEPVIIFFDSYKPGPHGAPALFNYDKTFEGFMMFSWEEIGPSPDDEKLNSLTGVKNIEPQRFNQIVERSSDAWVILFYSQYKNWCPSCTEVFEQFKKTINDLNSKGINVAKVLLDDQRDLAGQFNAFPFPSIKYFPTKEKTEDGIKTFTQEVTSQNIINWAVGEKKQNDEDHQYVLTEKTFQSLVMDSEDPWFVNFYTPNPRWCDKCVHLMPQFKTLSGLLKEQVKVGKLNCDNAKDLCKRFETYSFPKLKFFPAGLKEDDLRVEYEGALSAQDMADWILDQVKVSETRTHTYLDSEETFKKYCSEFNGACFITFLPEIKTSKDEFKRKDYLQIIEEVSLNFQTTPVSFVYTQQGEQDNLESQFKMCPNDNWPCILAMNFSKEAKKKGIKLLYQDFTYENFKDFATGLVTEARAFVPLKKALPVINTVDTNGNVIRVKQVENDDL